MKKINIKFDEVLDNTEFTKQKFNINHLMGVSSAIITLVFSLNIVLDIFQ